MKVVKVEYWKLSDIEVVESGWMLKVVKSSKLNLESCWMLKVESCQILWKCWMLKVC